MISSEDSLAGRARLGIPKLDARVEAVVRAARGRTPLKGEADGPPQWRPRHSHLAQRPGREKQETWTQLHLTHQTTPSTQEFQVLCSHAACTRKTAQHGTRTCARCSCLLFRSSSSPAIHRVSLCEVVRSRADGPPQRRPRHSHLAQRPRREKQETWTQLHLTHQTTPSTQEFHSLTHSLTHVKNGATQSTAQCARKHLSARSSGSQARWLERPHSAALSPHSCTFMVETLPYRRCPQQTYLGN